MTDSCTTTVIAILINLCFSVGSPYEMCVKGLNYGIRKDSYCLVYLKTNTHVQTFIFEDAVRYCNDNSGFINNLFVNDSERAELQMFLMTRLADSASMDMDAWSYSYTSAVPGHECFKHLTTTAGCGVHCAFKSCPVGTFGVPYCGSVCHCSDPEHCDIHTGACLDGRCEPGFFNPPTCHNKCHCNFNNNCNEITGECTEGCKSGWKGISCQERKCPNGRCRRKTKTNVKCKPGWYGAGCTIRLCPKGFYGPPSCKNICYCQYPQFCDVMDGNCKGTPCLANRVGWDCSNFTCPLTNFGFPDCQFLCFCKNGIPCDVNSGACLKGCKPGWNGPSCNKSFCPPERFTIPSCTSICQCKNQKVCNSFTGICETEVCQNETHEGTKCKPKKTLESHSTSTDTDYKSGRALWQIGTTLIVLFFGTLTTVVILNTCSTKRQTRRNGLITVLSSTSDSTSREYLKLRKSSTTFPSTTNHTVKMYTHLDEVKPVISTDLDIANTIPPVKNT